MSSTEEGNLFGPILNDISRQLDHTVKYWLSHSLDTKCGGFYNCLSKAGQVYDTMKYGWLQGRQVWTLARLYNDVKRFQTPEMLEAALHGCKFLQKFIKSDTTDRCYFSVTQEGSPTKTQRTIFTESFYTIALSEMYRATGDKSYLEKAIAMMDKIIYWSFTDGTEIGHGPVSEMSSHPLNIPLIVLGTLEQLYMADSSLTKQYLEVSREAASKVLQHVVEIDGQNYVLENVGQDGEKLDGSSGNLLNPGHAIEAGWFLLEYSQRDPDSGMDVDHVIGNFILRPMSYGWDEDLGGILYFLDARGPEIAPSQLEWHMKLWWPHNEAMIALLMAYELTPSTEIAELFQRVYKYSIEHFVDNKHGEWFGYLDRQGKPTSTAKGAPFKGCFHVPRCLLMCEQILTRILSLALDN